MKGRRIVGQTRGNSHAIGGEPLDLRSPGRARSAQPGVGRVGASKIPGSASLHPGYDVFRNAGSTSRASSASLVSQYSGGQAEDRKKVWAPASM